MEQAVHYQPLVVGMTGSFGSGCSYIADNMLVSPECKKISLSDILRDEAGKENQDFGTYDLPKQRKFLQGFGDKIRQTRSNGYLAAQAIAKIEQDAVPKMWVVDSIRNPHEIRELRKRFRQFYLLGIFADFDERLKRLHETYGDRKELFAELDGNDNGKRSPLHGQRVADCFYEADAVIENNKAHDVNDAGYVALKQRIKTLVDVFTTPFSNKIQPTIKAQLMTAAYAVSQRSSCLKRKVGAIIVDDETSTIISSGYNEVPHKTRPCIFHAGGCNRDVLKNKFHETLQNELNGDADKITKLYDAFNAHKFLDHCRALHAEENALLMLARTGSSTPLENCTLYTTTYPCTMCANKISNSGIKHIVYLEPYPLKDAKEVLNRNGVTQTLFEGITFRSYFRVYGEQK